MKPDRCWSRAPNGRPIRRLVLGVSCVVVASLAACGSLTQGTAPSRVTAIPWIATPGHVLQGLQGQSAPRPCAPADLSVSPPVAVGPYQGYTVESMLLTNVSATACVLSAPPTVTVRLASGGTVTAGLGAYSATEADLAPGQSATLTIGAPASCASYNPAAPRLASPISATLPAGGSLTVATAPPFDVQCGAPRVLDFFAHEPTGPPSSGEPALRVTLDAPSSASVGTTYAYTVTLTNPTASTISLAPCPSYTEGLTGDQGVLNTETYLLNCDTVTSLAPGASATFQMQYNVPPSLPQSSTKFWWVMQIPNGPAGGTSLQLSSGS